MKLQRFIGDIFFPEHPHYPQSQILGIYSLRQTIFQTNLNRFRYPEPHFAFFPKYRRFRLIQPHSHTIESACRTGMAVVSYNQSSRFQLPGQYFMTDPFVTIEEMLYFLFVHKTMDRIIIPDQFIGCPGHFTIQYNQQLSGIFQLFPTHFFKNFPDTGRIIMTHHDIRPPYNYTSGRRIKYFFDKGSHSLFNSVYKTSH